MTEKEWQKQDALRRKKRQEENKPWPECWRVSRRIACDRCGYPLSEARYGSVEEWRDSQYNNKEEKKDSFDVV